MENVLQQGHELAEAALWDRLRNGRDDPEAREVLVERHLPIVKGELGRLSAQIPSHIDRQELYAEGIVGLLAAVTNFDQAQGVEFTSYARRRIWGAMLDRLRSLGGVPRSSRQAARRITQALQRFTNRQNRQPDETELATEVGVPVEGLHELERQASLAQFLSLDCDNAGPDSETPGSLADQIEDRNQRVAQPLDQLIAKELRAHLVDGLRALPDRERAVLVLYYHQNLMLKEIAAAMSVSESRVSQLHSRALLRLRAFIEKAERLRSSAEPETIQPSP
jgi:RNA polymerase sigma factor for flagellar operon FliA